MSSAAEAELVRKAMRDAGLDPEMVSAFDEANLLKLHAEGYKTSIAFRSAREQDLRACGIPLGLIGVLFRGDGCLVSNVPRLDRASHLLWLTAGISMHLAQTHRNWRSRCGFFK